MPSEYLMYMSILLVGSLAIAGISVTMIGINSTISDSSIKMNLEFIVQKISETMLNIKQQTDQQIMDGTTEISLTVGLDIPEKLETDFYKIEVTTSEDGNYYALRGASIDNPDIYVLKSLLIELDEISMNGNVRSYHKNPVISYNYADESIIIQLSSG